MLPQTFKHDSTQLTFEQKALEYHSFPAPFPTIYVAAETFSRTAAFIPTVGRQLTSNTLLSLNALGQIRTSHILSSFQRSKIREFLDNGISLQTFSTV